ncbi:MAG: hypothetical protein WCI51_08255 [Lentisphaerota bacterium]
MKINWIRRQANWAFDHMCRHFAKAMPEHEHQFDSKEKSDVKFVCSPNFFKTGIKGDKKTIAHVDSSRWYEPFLKEE